MPRRARLDHPGAVHHVIVRGVERRNIFLDDEDRARFLRRLETVLTATGTRCFAYALMSNHYHLLLETAATPLSQVLHRLGTGHAMDFNRRHGRCGHLYQNRFKSKQVEDEAGFLAVLRYVHLNPLHARMVPDLRALGTWPWTGHAALLGNRRAPFLATGEVLRRFGDRPGVARRELLRWMAGELEGTYEAPGINRELANNPDGDGRWRDPGVLDRGCARIAMVAAGWTLDRVIGLVCGRHGLSETPLRAGRRTGPVSRAREDVAWLAAERLGLHRVVIARATGVSHQAVTRALDRAASRLDDLRKRFPELVA